MTLALLDPDRDQARELLERELSGPDYNRAEPLVNRLIDWLLARLDDIFSLIPGSQSLGWVLVLAVLVVVALVTFFAVRGRRRGSVLTQGRTGAVLEDPTLTAADYRSRADRAAQTGDWDTVLLDSYRALAADGVERTLLDHAAALTAHEVGRDLGRCFPAQQVQLAGAADAFDLVRYGEGSSTQQQATGVRDLDRTLSKTRPYADALT
ncbi:MAG: DUF4129 domain-containing protein [Ornithinimicrobium sp.]|uniref:DUF4129 domain-containing protein n=1 Tax=Ornithinimicrobium sp. TaxID=1977084 RepID=UPI003D9B8569